MSAAFEKTVDDIITFLNLSGDPSIDFDVGVSLRLKEFDGCDLFVANGALPADDQVRIPLNVTPELLPTNLQSAIVRDSAADGYDLELHRLRRVPPAALRGRVRRVLPLPIEVQSVWLNADDGSTEGEVRYYGRALGQWTHIPFAEKRRRAGSRTKFVTQIIGVSLGPGRQRFEDARAVSLQIGWSYVRQALWLVYIAPVDGIGVTFATDPSGAREAFRLRDKPPGAKRRSALLHWVRDHYRASRKNADDLRYVRQHFRGREEFVWNGLRCVITPAKRTLESVLADWEEASEKLRGIAARRSALPNP